MTRTANDAAGFTLLEMLIALSLLAVFSATLVGSLRFGIRADAHVNGRSQAEDQVARAVGFLRRRISQAQPVWLDAADPGHVDFEGRETSMSFLAPTPQTYGGIGFSRYVLATEADGTELRLTTQVADDPDGPSFSRSGSTALLDHIGALQFGYFGKLPDGSGAAWQSVWVDRKTLPTLVSITIKGRQVATGALDIVIRPRVDIDTTCQLYVQTNTCLGR